MITFELDLDRTVPRLPPAEVLASGAEPRPEPFWSRSWSWFGFGFGFGSRPRTRRALRLVGRTLLAGAGVAALATVLPLEPVAFGTAERAAVAVPPAAPPAAAGTGIGTRVVRDGPQPDRLTRSVTCPLSRPLISGTADRRHPPETMR